jgi:hypothetical protein
MNKVMPQICFLFAEMNALVIVTVVSFLYIAAAFPGRINKVYRNIMVYVHV